MIHRRPLVAKLLKNRPDDLLCVSGLGSSTWDLTASGDDPRNFCFIGAMGQAGPFALGLAMAQPDRRVVLFTGDGELLMGLGVLATIANQAPANLAIAVMDNEHYTETGGQPTATKGPTDLEAVAKGCGIATTATVTKDEEFDTLRELLMERAGPVLVNVKVDPEGLPLVFPHSFDGAVAFNRFQDAATR